MRQGINFQNCRPTRTSPPAKTDLYESRSLTTFRRPIHNRHAVATSLPLSQSRCSSACLCRCPGPDFCCRCQRRRQGPHCCLWPRWHLRHCSGTKRLLRRRLPSDISKWQSCQLCHFIRNVPMLQTSRENWQRQKNTTAKMANPCVNF